ncbi:MAG: asparagine synthase (glutamine-hydrolyzing) [Desulfobulbaceae bacterium]|nr:asparagine synthase (glutamine-hydrolyzing) [Desulfobulbaceae bacterium]
MCGVSFIYSSSGPSAELTSKMRASLNTLRHRGPDDEGIWNNKNTVIGHRRLSIIDLSASRQPMIDPSGRFVLSYNGEIYNYRELRAGLENHWNFRTKGDTEVLLAGLLVYGESFIEQVEGMWAFVLWDDKQKTLLACRDRMGKKPFYYQESGSGFICSSELPALACLADQPWDEDLDSTADFLRYGYYLPGTTAYQDVKEVLPGHSLRWSPESVITEESYWQLTLEPFAGNREEACEELRRLLIRSVEKRLVADVEVGAFLSGGVDSSLVVSILTKELGIRPKTFTIGFQERSYDERQYAQQIADYCATDHYVEVLESWDSHKLTDLIFNNIGQPFADSSLLPTALVSAVAASHVKVALSGDGGDELFSGYQRYQARAILRWYTRLPGFFRAGIGQAIRLLPEPMAHHSRSLLKKAHLFQDIIDRLEYETPYVAPVLYSKEKFNALIPDLAGRGHQPPHLPEECDLDDIQRMMTADALIYLPQDILLKVDRASMSCSLETRAPFLDRKVVELAFSLPRSWHRHGMRGKRMLHDGFQDFLPEAIWKRRKQGFGVPIHNWFREALGDELEELVVSIDSPINEKTVRQYLQQHRQKQRDHGYRLWSIYIYL